ncbi:hypothetical protein HY251_00830 [bacterium]|nr:hypothetical protein [bacterium]
MFRIPGERTASRRRVLVAVLLSLASLQACASTLGGAFSHEPWEIRSGLSEPARQAIALAWSGIPAERLLDYHTHMTGTGAGGTGNFVNPAMLSWLHPFRHMEYSVLLSASGVTDEERADEPYVPRPVGMDPLDPRCVPFYEKARDLGLILLSHAGEEKAVEAAGQPLGNPLRLRAALDHGLRVIVAHCSGLGEDEDLDSPEKPLVPSFDLFLRLMETKKYEGLVWGEISATTLANRCGTGSLERILRRTDLHPRLVNGSDYPLPAANVLLRTGKLEDLGFISPDERKVLREIYDYNPLLFDFMVKRLVVAPGTRRRFADSVFLEHASLVVTR